VSLELAGGNPSVAKAIRRDCTYTELAIAWQADRLKAEGIGYRIKQRVK
jgi:hypothetical protein